MNILITNVGRRNYIVDYFKEALEGIGKVIVTNSIEDTSGMYAADYSYIEPPIVNKEYIPFLIELCIKEQVSAIFSLLDMGVSAISLNKEKFLKNGILPIISDYDVVKRCFDKLSYFELLSSINIKSPRCFTSVSDVMDMVTQKQISFPLVIKPRWGAGSVSTNIVYDEFQLKIVYENLERNLKNSYLNNPVPEGYQNTLIIQEMIEGVEYGMDVVNDLNGDYITTWIKRKLEMRSGETDRAVTVKNSEYELIGEKVGRLLKHVGILDVDFIVTSDGTPYIIDLNPRFGGGYPFSHQAGANLPLAIVNWLQNKQVNEFLEIRDKVTSVKGLVLLSKE